MKKMGPLGLSIAAALMATQLLAVGASASPVTFPEVVRPQSGLVVTYDHPEPHRIAQTVMKSGLGFAASPNILPEGLYNLVDISVLVGISATDEGFVSEVEWPEMANASWINIGRSGPNFYAPVELGAAGNPVAETGGAGPAPDAPLLPPVTVLSGGDPAVSLLAAPAVLAPVAVVPVPAGLALMLTALGAFGIATRRRS